MALLAGSALLAACKGSGNYEVSNALSKSTDSISIVQADSIGSSTPKLVKTAELRFKVKSVIKSSEDISGLTGKYKGMVMHHQMNSQAERSNDVRLSSDSIMRVTSLSTSADMVVKVPSEKLEAYMTEVSRMGIYVSLRQMDIEDKTLDYLSNKLKLSARKELISKQKNGKIVIKHPEDVLALNDDMVDHQIDNQRVNEAVKYSVVSLYLYQSNAITKEVIANDDPSAYVLPFTSRIGMALANGWYIFKEILIVTANLWVIILAGGLIWFGFSAYRKKAAATQQTVQ